MPTKRPPNKPVRRAKAVEDPALGNPGRVGYRARRPVEHDGTRHEAGETIDLTPLKAAPLIATGALEAPSGT